MAKCIGCGVKLQSLNRDLPGYIPTIVNDELNEQAYCQRCFQIIHNGKKYQPLITYTDYYNKIKIIKDKNALVLLMIDLMDIYGGFIPNLVEYIGNNPVVILLNKVDLMPKDVKLKRIDERLRIIADEQKLKLKGIIMISALKKQNIDAVISKIIKIKKEYTKTLVTYRDKRTKQMTECYILGCASVGKSTLINAIKTKYLNDKQLLTTSDQFQTTMDFIKVYIDKNDYIIDTPGLINQSSYGAYLDYESMKILTPKTYLKPRTFQLNPDQTIFLGGLCSITFVSGEKINVSFYVSNDLYLHRTKTINAETIYHKQICKLLTPPKTINEYEKIKNQKTYIFQNLSGGYDLLISGIGFVHLVGQNINIVVSAYEKVAVRIVPEFI